MARVAELVEEYRGLLQACLDSTPGRGPNERIEKYTTLVRQFRASVRGVGDVEAELVRGLRGLLTDHDRTRADLWLNAADELASVGLVGPLCDLLDVRDRYVQHEWIAETLGDIGNEQAVPALARACSFDFDGAPSCSLPKRCLEALAQIGTPEAIAALRSQFSSPWPAVAEDAVEWAESLAEEMRISPPLD